MQALLADRVRRNFVLNNIVRPMDEKPNKHELVVADGSAETSHAAPPAVA
jgi:hypothetical protein